MKNHVLAATAVIPLLFTAPGARADTLSTVDVTQIGRVNAAYITQVSNKNFAQVNQAGIVNVTEVYQFGSLNVAATNQAGATNVASVNQVNVKITDFGDQYYLFAYQKDGYNLFIYGPGLPALGRLGRLR